MVIFLFSTKVLFQNHLTTDVFENSFQPVLQNMNLETKVNSAACSEKRKVYQHPKLSREVIATMDGIMKKLGPKIWQCKTCYKEFRTLRDSRRHAETHVEGQIHACGVCDRKFSSSSNLQGHRSKYQHNSDLKPYPKQDTFCYGCNKIFATISCLKEHKEAVHDCLRFPCDCCQHMASSRQNLRGHKLKKHPNEKTSSQLHPIKMTMEENKKINKINKERNFIQINYKKANWAQDPVPMDLEYSTEAMPGDRFEIKKCSVTLEEPEDIQNALREQVKLVKKLKARGLALRKLKIGDICYICGKKGSFNGIYIHRIIFHFLRGNNCRICESRNMSASNFKIHMTKHRP